MRWRATVVLLGALLMVPLAPGVAGAHPLGNFTVNHYDSLLLRPDAVELTAVVDRAEIPAAQALQTIAPDGPPSTEQLAAAATSECSAVADAVSLSVDGRAATWRSTGSTLESVPGAGGLPTLRLTCGFEADVALTDAAEVVFEDAYLADRIGWREITADGEGVRLVDSPVPVASISDELRAYPDDLLASPVDVRSFAVATEPGANTGTGGSLTPGSGDAFSNAMAALDRQLERLIGDRGLTPLAGILAVLLAVLLGCGHALLPGHGKTVMAAYLAGRGRCRDAVTVGATVTATHTVGVLVLGVGVSVSSSLAGDQVIRWLGVVSGLIVAGIGVGILRGALPRWRAAKARPLGDCEVLPEPALAAAVAGPAGGGGVHHEVAGEHPLGHGHGHSHDHDPSRDHGSWWSGGHTHRPATGRGGLIGMGVAGGLVPSPSALIVLLASIGLGRTVFGVVLVLAYGLGMAGTLTAVGLLLVRMRGPLNQRMTDRRGRPWFTRLALAAPVLTAGLVVVVGLALVTRGLVLGG